jgi:hypothetical protein
MSEIVVPQNCDEKTVVPTTEPTSDCGLPLGEPYQGRCIKDKKESSARAPDHRRGQNQHTNDNRSPYHVALAC